MFQNSTWTYNAAIGWQLMWIFLFVKDLFETTELITYAVRKFSNVNFILRAMAPISQPRVRVARSRWFFFGLWLNLGKGWLTRLIQFDSVSQCKHLRKLSKFLSPFPIGDEILRVLQGVCRTWHNGTLTVLHRTWKQEYQPDPRLCHIRWMLANQLCGNNGSGRPRHPRPRVMSANVAGPEATRRNMEGTRRQHWGKLRTFDQDLGTRAAPGCVSFQEPTGGYVCPTVWLSDNTLPTSWMKTRKVVSSEP